MTSINSKPENEMNAHTPTPTLAPCPFCGGEGVGNAIRDGRQIICRKCYACGPAAFHGPSNMPSAHERAVTGWNRRAELRP